MFYLYSLLNYISVFNYNNFSIFKQQFIAEKMSQISHFYILLCNYDY